MAASPPIRAQGLVKRFGDFTAVDGIDIHVDTGEIYGLLGPNGSGKTTTIRMLLGLLQPSAGTAEVLGFSMNDNPEGIRPYVGYMSQRFSLYSDLTVMENLVFNGRAYGLPPDQMTKRISEAIHLSGLVGRERIRTSELSGGWRQRLALSAAILHRPTLLFLDEPTAGVDPVSRRVFWDLLYQLADQGTTVFVTTHYMDEAEHCHRLAFIRRGLIIASGSPDEIKQEVMDGQVLEISADDPAAALEVLRSARQSGRLPIQEVSMYGALIHVVAPKIEEVLSSIEAELREAGVGVRELATIEPSLEDVFIASMQKPSSVQSDAEPGAQTDTRQTPLQE